MKTYEVGNNKDVIMVIYVLMAKREQKPVYINNDIFNALSVNELEVVCRISSMFGQMKVGKNR